MNYKMLFKSYGFW